MTPKPEGWLSRIKRQNPTILVRNLAAFLRIISGMGWGGFSLAQIGVLEAQLTILAPTILWLVCGLLDWLLHLWLWWQVSPKATTEPMAETLDAVQTAQAKGQPAPRISEAANRAKNRVLGRTEDALPNVNVEPL